MTEMFFNQAQRCRERYKTSDPYELLESLQNDFFSLQNELNALGFIGVSNEITDIMDNISEAMDLDESEQPAKIEEFDAFDKLYTKKLTYDTIENKGDEPYLRCFNKSYFVWIDSDEHYDIEFRSNKIKFISVDGKGTKTYVVLTPVRFA